jgi:transcriptional regulator with XRE-family HTH domain
VDLKALGKRLNGIRKARGLSLETLSAQARVAKNSIGPIENGKANPTLKTLEDIATTLGVPFGAYVGSIPSDEPASFDAAIDFLARFEGLEPVFQKMVLTLVYQDDRYTRGIRVPPEAQAEIQKLFGPLLKARS